MPSTQLAWRQEARALGAISASVSLTMAAQMALATVETVMVARLGVAALAGVALAASVWVPVFLFSLGVVTAITPVVAHALGAGDQDGVRASGQQGIWVGLAVSVPATAVALACSFHMDMLIGNAAVAGYAGAYLFAVAWGLPAWVTYVAVRSLAVATGRVRVTTIIMVASLPVHAGLTWLLVFGGPGWPGFGVTGAGAAYAISGFVALGLLPAMLWRGPADAFASVFRGPYVFDRRRAGEIVRLGLPFACRILLRESVLPAAAFMLAPFGAVPVAAHAVAEQAVMLAGVAAFGFSDAANMRVSALRGAGLPDQARQAARIAILLSACVSAAIAGVVAVMAPWIARWVLGPGDAVVLDAATGVLRIAALLLVLEGVQSAAGGALSGWRDAKGPLGIAIVGAWGIAMPGGFVLARLGGAPAAGMWWGLVAGAGVTTWLYLARLRRRMAAG